VNNEIGTIYPISEVSKTVQKFKRNHKIQGPYPLIHTDASQGLMYLKITVATLGIDLLSIDGQKIYGPKGVGALFIKRGVTLAPFLIGGSQEFGLRPGTVNIPLIIGFKKALELADEHREREVERLVELRDLFVAELTDKVPRADINGSLENRIVNNLNVSFPGMNNENLVVRLDVKGISCGTRSACISDNGKGSYVIRALGKSEEHATSSLRFSLGAYTTEEDVHYVIAKLRDIVADFDKTTLS
jgi:cysteine desulfurase